MKKTLLNYKRVCYTATMYYIKKQRFVRYTSQLAARHLTDCVLKGMLQN